MANDDGRNELELKSDEVLSAAHIAVGQKMLADLREANEKLVLAAIRAQELTDLAEAAQAKAELATEKLRESERELHDTAELRERLLGIVGHDLRNPLAAISMGVQCLLSEEVYDREHISELVGFLLRSIHRMDRMIKQLFEFTRARFRGGVPLELGATDLRPLCQHAIEELALRSGTQVTAEFRGDTTGTWDGKRLIEALSNLICNARDHATPQTAVVVTAYGEQSEVVVEIINQGQPIPEALLPVLFVAFHRAKLGFERRPGHLGLGLFIAHEIVRSHGGTLGGHSAAGATTFMIRLPRTPISPPVHAERS